MKKKIFALLAAMLMSAVSYAQFEEGKTYLNASVSGLDLNYTKRDNWSANLSGMVLANLEYGYHDKESSISIGPAIRYYVVQNGLYLGAGTSYVHRPSSYNDFMPHVHVGYAYFVNGHLTIEPELYYNQSFNNQDYSGIGVRVGLGFYF